MAKSPNEVLPTVENKISENQQEMPGFLNTIVSRYEKEKGVLNGIKGATKGAFEYMRTPEQPRATPTHEGSQQAKGNMATAENKAFQSHLASNPAAAAREAELNPTGYEFEPPQSRWRQLGNHALNVIAGGAKGLGDVRLGGEMVGGIYTPTTDFRSVSGGIEAEKNEAKRLSEEKKILGVQSQAHKNLGKIEERERKEALAAHAARGEKEGPSSRAEDAVLMSKARAFEKELTEAINDPTLANTFFNSKKGAEFMKFAKDPKQSEAYIRQYLSQRGISNPTPEQTAQAADEYEEYIDGLMKRFEEAKKENKKGFVASYTTEPIKAGAEAGKKIIKETGEKISPEYLREKQEKSGKKAPHGGGFFIPNNKKNMPTFKKEKK